jgi:hypothetical protein
MAYPDNPEVTSSYSFQIYGSQCLKCAAQLKMTNYIKPPNQLLKLYKKY